MLMHVSGTSALSSAAGASGSLVLMHVSGTSALSSAAGASGSLVLMHVSGTSTLSSALGSSGMSVSKIVSGTSALSTAEESSGFSSLGLVSDSLSIGISEKSPTAGIGISSSVSLTLSCIVTVMIGTTPSITVTPGRMGEVVILAELAFSNSSIHSSTDFQRLLE